MSRVGEDALELDKLDNVALSLELLYWCCSTVGLGGGGTGDDNNGEDEPATPEPFVVPDPPDDRAKGLPSFSERDESEVLLLGVFSRACNEVIEEDPC